MLLLHTFTKNLHITFFSTKTLVTSLIISFFLKKIHTCQKEWWQDGWSENNYLNLCHLCSKESGTHSMASHKRVALQQWPHHPSPCLVPAKIHKVAQNLHSLLPFPQYLIKSPQRCYHYSPTSSTCIYWIPTYLYGFYTKLGKGYECECAASSRGLAMSVVWTRTTSITPCTPLAINTRARRMKKREPW